MKLVLNDGKEFLISIRDVAVDFTGRVRVTVDLVDTLRRPEQILKEIEK